MLTCPDKLGPTRFGQSIYESTEPGMQRWEMVTRDTLPPDEKDGRECIAKPALDCTHWAAWPTPMSAYALI